MSTQAAQPKSAKPESGSDQLSGAPELAHYVNQLPQALKLLINGEKSRLEILERFDNEALNALVPETKKKIDSLRDQNYIKFWIPFAGKYGIIPENRLTTGNNVAHTPSGNSWCAPTFGMAHTVGGDTRMPQFVDPGGTVPFPFPVPYPVPVTKIDQTENPTPQALMESEKTSVKSGGLEGKILRRSLVPKARMRPQTTVPKARKPAQTQKPADGTPEKYGRWYAEKVRGWYAEKERRMVRRKVRRWYAGKYGGWYAEELRWSRPSRPSVRFQATKT